MEDDVWFAVQDRFAKRTPDVRAKTRSRAAAKYALTGIAYCGGCGGALRCTLTTRRGERVKAYACARHCERGPEACPVTVNQPMDEVEAALIEALQRDVMTDEVLEQVLTDVRHQIEVQMPKPNLDVDSLEADLREVRAEQRKLAKAVALAANIPELVAELTQRSERIENLERQLAAARRPPEEVVALSKEIESTCRARLADLHAALANKADLREVLLALFPDGLELTPEWAADDSGNGNRSHLKGGRRTVTTRDTTRPPKNRRIWRAKGLVLLSSQSRLRPQRDQFHSKAA